MTPQATPPNPPLQDEPARGGAAARSGAGVAAELDRVAERYARRPHEQGPMDRYSPLRPDVWQLLHERQRAILRGLARMGYTDLSELRLMEVGCGAGGNLLEFLRLGFAPGHLMGCELLPKRLAVARERLPAAVQLTQGDAGALPVAPGSLDLVFVATVFSSLLDDAVQSYLAEALWRWLRPGGAVLWYDFAMDNPANPDVRGVPLRRVRQLFPQGRMRAERITLAPPIARRVCALHPALYPVFNAVPWLRSHRLAWIVKP
jgi:SAM-dependent methyltransferase